MRQVSIDMSCVAEAKAPAAAAIAMSARPFSGSVEAITRMLAAIAHWQERIHPLRRPKMEKGNSGLRLTTGDHRNLKA